MLQKFEIPLVRLFGFQHVHSLYPIHNRRFLLEIELVAQFVTLDEYSEKAEKKLQVLLV